MMHDKPDTLPVNEPVKSLDYEKMWLTLKTVSGYRMTHHPVIMLNDKVLLSDLMTGIEDMASKQ